MRSRLRPLVGAALLVACSLRPLEAQARPDTRLPRDLQTPNAGQQRGPVTGLVAQQELRPGEVQTISLVPGYQMTLEFPYPIVRVDVGDDSLFIASKYSNKLALRAATQRLAETSVNLTLGDADLTVVPMIVRIDSLAPRVQVLRYTDPMSQELNRSATRIAERLAAETDSRVEQLTETRLRQRLLLASTPQPLNRQAEVRGPEGRVRLLLDQIQQVPGDDGQPRLYVRYRVENFSPVAIADLQIRIQVVRTAGTIFGRAVRADVYDLEDARSSQEAIQGGTSVLGLLSMLPPALRDGETVSIVATFWNGTRSMTIDRVIAGPTLDLTAFPSATPRR